MARGDAGFARLIFQKLNKQIPLFSALYKLVITYSHTLSDCFALTVLFPSCKSNISGFLSTYIHSCFTKADLSCAALPVFLFFCFHPCILDKRKGEEEWIINMLFLSLKNVIWKTEWRWSTGNECYSWETEFANSVHHNNAHFKSFTKTGFPLLLWNPSPSPIQSYYLTYIERA